MKNVCRDLGIVPVYPVKGGCLGENPKKLAWGKYNFYDALAPEFNSYKTIEKLMNDP